MIRERLLTGFLVRGRNVESEHIQGFLCSGGRWQSGDSIKGS